MPRCNCSSHKCNNRDVTARVLKEHQQTDQLLWRTNAYRAYQQKIDERDEALATEVAALTLSGGAASPASLPTPTLPSPEYTAKARPSPIRDAHTILAEISKDLEGLENSIKPRLSGLGRPCLPTEKFPLGKALQQARSLENRLARALLPAEALRKRKVDYTTRLQALLSSLKDAGSLWAARARQLAPTAEMAYTYNTDVHFEPILNGVDPIIQISLFTMVALQIVLHLSRRGCRFLLAMVRYIIQLAFLGDRFNLSEKKIKFITNFPIDPDSAIGKFPLDGKETIYAACPNAKCHKTYAPTFAPNSAIPSYPKFCTHKEFESEPECGTALTRSHMYHETEIRIPVKPFLSFSFKEYLANLLCRPGFEDLMDKPERCDQPGVMKDFCDGEFIRVFTDANAEPFESSFEIGRYTFSVCMDFFNPFTNKQAGKKKSIGIISVVCTSLPATHRYKAENMFLAGVIPGPNEPPLNATNHYLSPLVDEFLELWEPGVKFSRTAKCPRGRLVLCALVLVVCDLLAARKTAGCAACTHNHFCTLCDCTLKEEGLDNTSYETWKRRTNEKIRSDAERYRTAATPEDQRICFKQTGVRWSELLRLPYFDITRCVVVDSMHNLFLGLLREHYMEILGIGKAVEREQPVMNINLATPPSDFKEKDCKGIKSLKKWLEAPAAISFPSHFDAIKKLKRPNLNALKFVCEQLHCSVLSDKQKATKQDFATALLEWRLDQAENRPVGADTSTRQGHVLALDDMQEIWDDLSKILTPSWSTSVPSNLGNAAHGKLKADQWRTLGTVHLPLTLIRIWSDVDPSNPRSVRCRRILEVTMSLVSAVTIAASRTTSVEHASEYLRHMRAYLDGIKELFPDYELHPNHHMALHLHEFLLLFGPVHSWWTFPFERMIGALQRMPHNFKIGELESTIARAYTRSANLRALLSKSGCPEVIRNSEDIFLKLVDPQVRDSLQTDIRYFEQEQEYDADSNDTVSAGTQRPLNNDLRNAFGSAGISPISTGHFLPNLSIRGLMYSTYSKHRGNACVILANSRPAQVHHIIQLPTHPQVSYFAIRCHNFSPQQYDPYRGHSVLGARLWDTELGELEIVTGDNITCHFACLPYGDRAVVAVPLSRTVFF